MMNGDEYQTSLLAANGLIDRLREEVKAVRKLSELQDKLLVCYRVGENPGSILDKLRNAREKVERLGIGKDTL